MNPMPPTEPTAPPNPGADAHAAESNTIRQAAAPRTDPARWDPVIVDRLSAWAALSLVQDRSARLLDGGGLVDQRVDLADLFIPLTTKVKTGNNTWESRDLGAALLDPGRLPRVAEPGASIGFGGASVDGPDLDPEAPTVDAGPSRAEPPTAASLHFGSAISHAPSLIAQDQSAYRTEARPILVVEGPAGYGKTTTSIFVAQALRLGWLQRHRPDRLLREPQRTISDGLGARLSSLGWPQHGTPFPIRLDLARYRGGPTGLWSWLHDALQEHGPAPTAPELMTFFQSGFPTTWFLDGLDETPFGESRVTLLRGLLDTLTALPYATVIIGTRPEPLDPQVVAHYPMVHLPIEPLSRETALAYAAAVIRRTSPHPDQIEAATARITTTGSSAALDDLLRTPLHTTLLSFLALREPELPNNRAALLGQVFEVVLQREQRKPSVLQLTKKEQQALRWLHERAALYLYFDPDRPTLRFMELRTLLQLRLREQNRDFPNPNTSLRRILQVSNQRLGLLLESSPDRWTFGIRSFTEYFAACALLDAPEPVLLHRLQSLAWTGTHNTLLYLACERLLQTATTDTAQAAATNLLLRLCDEYPADPPELHDLLQTLDLGAALALRLLEELGPDAPGELREGLWERALRLVKLGVRWVPALLEAMPATAPRTSKQGSPHPPIEPAPPIWLPKRLANLAIEQCACNDRQWTDRLRSLALSGTNHPNSDESAYDWSQMLELYEGGGIGCDEGFLHGLMPAEGTMPWWETATARHPLLAPMHAAHRVGEKSQHLIAQFILDRGFPDRPDQVFNLFPEEGISPVPPEELSYLWRRVPSALDPEQQESIGEDLQRFGGWTDGQRAPVRESFAPYRWTHEFIREPTPQNLASLLRRCGLHPPIVPLVQRLANIALWPLKTCLAWCKVPADYLWSATWIEQGEAGEAQDWTFAQSEYERTTFDLVEVEDWLHLQSPWDRSHPHAAIFLSSLAPNGKYSRSLPWSQAVTNRLVEIALAAVTDNPSQAGRLLSLLGDHTHTGWLREQPSPSRSVIQALPRFGSGTYPYSHIWKWSCISGRTPLEEHDFLRLHDWGMRHGFTNRTLQMTKDSRTTIDIAQRICNYYSEHPHLYGLLSAIHALVRIEVPLNVDEIPLANLPKDLPDHLQVDAETLSILQGTPLGFENSEVDFRSLTFRALRIQTVAPLVLAQRVTRSFAVCGPNLPRIKTELRQLGISAIPAIAKPPDPWSSLRLTPPTPTELTMHLRGPVLNAIPCLSGIRIFDQTPDGLDHFDIGNGEEGQWVVLIGENGTGKTTLLRAIALALMEPERATKLLDNRTAMTGATGEGQITVKVSGHDWTVKVQEIGGGDEVVRAEKEGHAPGAERPWIVGYGARRGNALGDPRHEPNGTMMGNLGSLFENPGVMVNGYAWLLEQQGWAVRERETSNGAMGPQQTLWNVVKGAMEQLLQVEIIEPFTKSREGILVRHAEFGQVPLRGLSEGYLGFAGWVLDMVYRWVRYLEDRGETPTSDLLAEMRGIVLVDEIDLHLHPRWQVEIIPDLRRLFPRLSFIVTTHNPLTLYGARPGEVRVLQRDPDARGGIRVEPKKVQPGEDMDRLLLELFGVSYPYDPQLRSDLATYHTLLREGKTKDDPQRIALSRRLDERLRMGGIGTPGVATTQQRGPTPEELALLDDVMSGKGRR